VRTATNPGIIGNKYFKQQLALASWKATNMKKLSLIAAAVALLIPVFAGLHIQGDYAWDDYGGQYYGSRSGNGITNWTGTDGHENFHSGYSQRVGNVEYFYWQE
jgi:hypothetical protein